MIKILQSFTPDIEIYSIDKPFLNLSPLLHVNHKNLAESIFHTVLKQIGIPITVGIGPTKTLVSKLLIV
jgi:DNA polymerase V